MWDSPEKQQSDAWHALHGELSAMGMYSDPDFKRIDGESGTKMAIRFVRHLSRKGVKPDCGWEYSDREEYYKCGCGKMFTFIDDGIKENNFKFCPYCGGRIVEESSE